MTADRAWLTVYHQALMAGLKGAARLPTNLAKIREVLQGSVELLSVFVERLLEAYWYFTDVFCNWLKQGYKLDYKLD